jgi:hypothetical protein
VGTVAALHDGARSTYGAGVAWRGATLLVQPATILRWHRAGVRVFWRRRSRPSGRPPAARAALIREMAASNKRGIRTSAGMAPFVPSDMIGTKSTKRR